MVNVVRSMHSAAGFGPQPHFGVRFRSGFECKPLPLLNVSLSYHYGLCMMWRYESSCEILEHSNDSSMRR
jgi:hypothetical protein